MKIPFRGGGGEGGVEAPPAPKIEAPRPPAESAEPTAEQQAAAQAKTAQKKGGATAALKGLATRAIRGEDKPPFGLTGAEIAQVGLINSPDPATRQQIASLAESVRNGTNIDEATAGLGPEWKGAVQYELGRKPVTEVAAPTAEVRSKNPLGLSDQDIRNLQLVQNRDPAIRQQIADLADRVAAGESIDSVTSGLGPEWRNAVQYDLGQSGIRIDAQGNTLPVEETPGATPAAEVIPAVDASPVPETTRLGGPPGETSAQAAKRIDDLMRAAGASQQRATEAAAPVVEPPMVSPDTNAGAEPAALDAAEADRSEGTPSVPGAVEPPPGGPLAPRLAEAAPAPGALALDVDGGAGRPPGERPPAPPAPEPLPGPEEAGRGGITPEAQAFLDSVDTGVALPGGEYLTPAMLTMARENHIPVGRESTVTTFVEALRVKRVAPASTAEPAVPAGPVTAEPGDRLGEAGPGNLTPDGLAVLASVDNSEIPPEILAGTDIPASLRTTAEANGITIDERMTAGAVVEALRAKGAAVAPERVEPAAIVAEPVARPVEAAFPAPAAALRAEPAAAGPAGPGAEAAVSAPAAAAGAMAEATTGAGAAATAGPAGETEATGPTTARLESDASLPGAGGATSSGGEGGGGGLPPRRPPNPPENGGGGGPEKPEGYGEEAEGLHQLRMESRTWSKEEFDEELAERKDDIAVHRQNSRDARPANSIYAKGELKRLRPEFKVLLEEYEKKFGKAPGAEQPSEAQNRQEQARNARAKADRAKELTRKSASELNTEMESTDAAIKALEASRADASGDELTAIDNQLRELRGDKAAIESAKAGAQTKEKEATAKEAKGEADRLRREQSTPTELQATVDALKTQISTLETQLQADPTNADLNEKLKTVRTRLGQEEEALKAAKEKAKQERGIKDKFTTEDIRRISNPDYLALPAEEQAKYLQELFHGVKEFTAVDYDKIQKEFEGGGNPSIEERARFAKTMVDRWKERGRPSKDDLRLMHHLYGKNQDVALAIMENWAESEAGNRALKEQFPSMSEQAWRFVKKHKNWFMILAAILAIGAVGPSTAVIGAAKFAGR